MWAEVRKAFLKERERERETLNWGFNHRRIFRGREEGLGPPAWIQGHFPGTRGSAILWLRKDP